VNEGVHPAHHHREHHPQTGVRQLTTDNRTLTSGSKPRGRNLRFQTGAVADLECPASYAHRRNSQASLQPGPGAIRRPALRKLAGGAPESARWPAGPSTAVGCGGSITERALHRRGARTPSYLLQIDTLMPLPSKYGYDGKDKLEGEASDRADLFQQDCWIPTAVTPRRSTYQELPDAMDRMSKPQGTRFKRLTTALIRQQVRAREWTGRCPEP